MVSSLVAYRFHSLNWLLGVAWVFLLLHFISALVPWRASGPVGQSSEGTFVITRPSHPGLAYVYIGSAVASFLATLVGLIMSLTRALQSSPVDATRQTGQAGEQ